MSIERNIPLAVKVSSVLRRRLRLEPPTDGKLNGEDELALEFGVSRGTIRQALTILEREGIIIRKQGAGTYINPYLLPINVRGEVAYEFSQLIEYAGFQPSVSLLDCIETQANDEEVKRLGLAPRSKLIHIHKLFCANNEPAICCQDMIPKELFQTDFSYQYAEKPVFDILETYCSLRVDYVLAEIVPHISDEYFSTILKMPIGLPLLCFIETSFSVDNSPIMLSRIYYKDPIIRFSIMRKKS